MESTVLIERFLRRARGRQLLVRAVHGLFLSLLPLSLGMAGLFWMDRLVGLTLPGAWLAGGTVAVAVSMILACVVFPRQGKLALAAQLDEAAGWKERLSSFVAIGRPARPMELALVDDVRAKVETARVSELLPWTGPRCLRWLPVALAITLAGWFAPPLDLLGLRGSTAENAKKEDPATRVAEKLEKKVKERKKPRAGVRSRRTEQARKQIEALAQKVRANPRDKKQAMAQVSQVSDQLKKAKEEVQTAEQVAEELEKAASNPAFDFPSDMAKMIQNGRFSEAAKELAGLRRMRKDPELSEEQKRELDRKLKEMAAQMEEMAKSLEQSLKDLEGDPRALEKMKEMIEGLKDAAKELADAQGEVPDTTDLEELLDALDSDLADLEDLKEMLGDLEDFEAELADLVEGEPCPFCKLKRGEGDPEAEGS